MIIQALSTHENIDTSKLNELIKEFEAFQGDKSRILIIEYDPAENEQTEPVPIMCGECWLNTGTPFCKCLTNNPK